jgi:hypothetical protein
LLEILLEPADDVAHEVLLVRVRLLLYPGWDMRAEIGTKAGAAFFELEVRKLGCARIT